MWYVICKGQQSNMKTGCVSSTADFARLLRLPTFVDKTLFIKEFILSNWTIIVIYVPRLFGKTANLNMLEIYFSARPIGIYFRRGYKTHACKYFLKFNLSINWDQYFYYQHCGEYPVLYMNFKQVSGNNVTNNCLAFKRMIADAFHEYETVLLKPLALRPIQQEDYKNFLYDLLYMRVGFHTVLEYFMYLVQLLHQFYHQKVIILIDDIDAPILNVANESLEKTLDLIRSFMHSLLKDTRFIAKVLIASSLRSSRVLTDIVETTTNVVHFPFLGDHPFTRYFGLTVKEVKGKLSEFNIASKYEEVADWYDGYVSASTGLKLYNTWSIINFLETEVADNYWAESIGFENLAELFLKESLRKPLTQLLEWKAADIDITKKTSLLDIRYLVDIMQHKKFKDDYRLEKYLLFLTDNGYFSPSYTGIDRNTIRISLTIPNNEIYNHLFSLVYSKLYYKKYFKNDLWKINFFFFETLNRIGVEDNNTVSLINFRDQVVELYRNKRKPNNEHDFLGSIYYCISSSWQFSHTKLKVDKKLTTVQTRAEVVTVRSDDGTRIVVETKYNRKSATEALQQIVNQAYSVNVLENKRIYIGLFMNQEGSVQVCGLINSEDLNCQICV